MHSTKSKQIVAGFVGIAMALSFVFVGVSTPAQAATVEELTAQINSLLSTISSLQSQLTTMQGGSASTGYTFTTTLKLGSSGEAVKQLQVVLNKSADTQVSSTGAGSPGSESTYFGAKTKAAVIKFQQKYAAEVLTPVGLTTGTGIVGAATRAKLNTMTGGTTTGGTTGGVVVPAGAGLSVSAPTQPAPQLAPQGANRVPFTKVTLTAGSSDVVVNGITVTRVGPAVDSDFAGIVLVDQNGLQVGVAKTLNSNHQATVGDTFTVKAGTSATYTIAGNMAASLALHAGEVPALAVSAINTSAPVTGTLPITGTGQTTNATLTVGSATAYKSSFDPNAHSSQNIGTTGYRFAGIRLTAGSAEDVTLWSVRWNQSGSASASDLANIVTVVDGVQYPTTISADGKYYTTLFPSGLSMAKGFSKDIYVQGDIVGTGAANRTVEFDVYKNTDVYLSGNTYGYGITATPNSTGPASTDTEFTTSNPWFSGSVVTVSAGSVTTITNATAVPSANIAVNVPNQVLGGYTTDIKGEPISVQSMVFHIASSTVTAATNLLLTSVSLVDDNGAVVAGPVDAVADTTASCGGGSSYCNQKVTFTDTVTYPVGKKTYTLKGKVGSTVANGAQYTVITSNTDWTTVTGQTTGNAITLPTFTASLNPMTVRTAALAVSVSTSPAAQQIIAGTVGQLFANIQLDASQSGEDMRFSSVPMTLTGTATSVTGCQLFNGSTALNTGANVVNPTAAANTFLLDAPFTVAKGTVATIGVKCNVSSAATGDYHWDMTSADVATDWATSVTGVTSSQTVTPTGSGIGATMSVGVATLAVSADASSPSYTIVPSGSSGVTMGVLKFRATNDAVNLQRIVLKLTNSASSSASDLVSVTIWDGTTQVGSAIFTGTNTKATSTLSTPVLLTKDADKSLTVKANLSTVGNSQPVTVSGHLVAIDIDGSDSTGTYGTGVGSGATVNASGSTAFAGVRVMKSMPTLAADTLSGSGVSDGRLLRFKVTADQAGPVSIAKFTVTISTTSATVSNVNIYGFSDPAYSQAISGLNTGGQFLSTNVDMGLNISAPTLSIYPQSTGAASTTVQVPAGQTRYFEVRGTVAGSGTTYSVTTTLKGDTAYPRVNNTFYMTTLTSTSTTSGLGGPTAGDGAGNSALNNFVWSPNSTTSPAVSDVDWTNGYGLLGLPSSGIIQTRSN